MTDSTGQRDRANRVLRGGSWNNTSTNVRAANRNNNTPSNRNNNNGFRLASTRSARVAAPTGTASERPSPALLRLGVTAGRRPVTPSPVRSWGGPRGGVLST